MRLNNIVVINSTFLKDTHIVYITTSRLNRYDNDEILLGDDNRMVEKESSLNSFE